MRSKLIKMKKWKRLFWGLVMINIMTIIVIMIVLFQPFNGMNKSHPIEQNEEIVELSIETNKTDLNRLINHFLEEEAHNKAVDYQVRLGEDVELLGKINVFDSNIPFNMTFIPDIQTNGDLILRQKSMSVGMIELPVPIVLNYVKKHYSIPKWVKIQPKQQTIYVALNKMETKSGFKVKVKKFDLENDNFQFKLGVPIDKE